MLRAVIAAAAVLSIAACATPTPYQASGPETGSRYGYAEEPIERDRFRVSFSGNLLTDRETVETYMLYRAAELTLQNGYDHFLVADRDTIADERRSHLGPYGSGYRPGYGFGYYAFHPYYPGFHIYYAFPHLAYGPRSRFRHSPYGWPYDYAPFGEIYTRTRYEAFAEVSFGRGTKPGRENAFDARDVIANLGPQIIRPQDLESAAP